MTTATKPPSPAQLRRMSNPRARLYALAQAGVAQIDRQTLAAVLDIKPNTIDKKRTRGSMPEPSGYLGRTPYWLPEAVDELLSVREERQNRQTSLG